MPRAFMFTRRQDEEILESEMNDMDIEDTCQEHSLSVLSESSNASISGTEDLTNDTDNSSECPDELYNLTKLANVSVAAAAGKIFDRGHLNMEKSYDEEEFMYTHKLFDKTTKAVRGHLIKRDKRPQSTINFVNLATPSIAATILKTPLITPLNKDTHTQNEKSNISNSNHIRLDEPLEKTDFTSTQFHKHESFQSNKIKRSSKVTSTTIDVDCQQTEEQIASVSSGGAVEAHSCRDCGKCYSTSSNLARHRQTHRSPGDKKARRCPHCDKLYVSMPAYAMHVRTHNQGCRCQFCGKCFSRPWLLQGHIRTHTGEKPFKCNICNKAFADKSNLRAHVQTHSNLKPHVCKRCGKAFALKSYLYKHEESSCMRFNNNNNNTVCIKSEDQSLSRSPIPNKSVIVQNFNKGNSSSVITKNTSFSSADSSSPSNSIASSEDLLQIEQLEQQNKVLNGASFLSPIKTPTVYFRSTVISPNPERILYSTIEHPSVILNAATRFYSTNKYLQEQPMDFSKGVKMAIAV